MFEGFAGSPEDLFIEAPRRMATSGLDLDDYAALVKLSEPWHRRRAIVAPTEVNGLVDRVLRHVGRNLLAPAEPRECARSPRERLRALLTVRPPGPLPAEIHDAIDRWLGDAAARRRETAADGLSRLAPGADADGLGRCALWRGDITTLQVDAIVNAANSALLGCFEPFHACIDNAIHHAAGPRLREDCDAIVRRQGHREPTGTAKVTRGYNLPARFVLHTVGPIFHGTESRAESDRLADALAASYRACLTLAARIPGLRSIALCGVSTGVFGCPRDLGATVAIRTTLDFLRQRPGALDLVVFNVFSAADHEAYERAIETELAPHDGRPT